MTQAADTLKSPESPDAGHITIWLGDQPHRVPPQTVLADLLAQLGHAELAVSTAVNGEFVPRVARAQRVLAEGDRVLLFQPIVGG